LNIDVIGENVRVLLSHNTFAYCLNNPVNMLDGDGEWPRWLTNVANALFNLVQGIGAGISYGISRRLDSVYARYDERTYLVGKILDNAVIAYWWCLYNGSQCSGSNCNVTNWGWSCSMRSCYSL
jgi:hypothetical protein